MELNIPAKIRKQYLVSLLPLIALIAICVNMLVQTKYMKTLVLNGLFNYLIASAGLLWALYRLLQHLLVIGKEWVSSNASLIITEKALVNQLNFYSSGTISFEEMNGTNIVKFKGKEYLTILLKQPDKFIAGKPLIKKALLKRARKSFGTPIVFAEDQIQYDLEKLQTIINSHLILSNS